MGELGYVGYVGYVSWARKRSLSIGLGAFSFYIRKEVMTFIKVRVSSSSLLCKLGMSRRIHKDSSKWHRMVRREVSHSRVHLRVSQDMCGRSLRDNKKGGRGRRLYV